MKKAVCLLLSLTVFILCFSGCAENQTVKTVGVRTQSTLSGSANELENAGEKLLVSENDNYRLFYCAGGIRVESVIDSQVFWDSAVDETVYDGFAASTETWKNYMQSLAAITYIAKNDSVGNFSVEYSAASRNITAVERYSNGIKITVKFAKSAITVSFEITLEDSGINIRIPGEEIKEEGEFYLYSVELLPFFGAAPNGGEGYIFYPDGCGALSCFNKTAEKHKYTKQLVLDIYGTEETGNYFSEEKNPVASLPVYGIKNADKAFLAAITAGEADAQVNVNAGLNISSVKLNRASFTLIYRNKYSVSLSELKKSGETQDGKNSVIICDELLNYDREVRLFFLKGENADYSGMANVYREYLLEDDILDGKTSYKTTGLYLRFFMGTMQNNAAYKKSVKTTDFSDVEDILSEYISCGVENITATLRGWQSGGYGDNISSFKPDGAYGGVSGLKELDEFAGKNGVNLMLEAENINVYDGTGFFIKGRDTVTDGSGSPVTNSQQSVFIFNPLKVQSNFEKLIKSVKKYNNIKILNDGLGSVIYSDLNSSSVYVRYQVKQIFENILKQYEDKAEVSAANLYAIKYADFIADCPSSTSGAFIEDFAVPWYQMIVHGSAAYCADTGNSSYDLKYQKLRWIEYGSSPYFEITKKEPSVLRDTDYTQLFSSKNDEWQERIIDIYKEYKENFSNLTDGYITEHKIISAKVVSVSYDSGVTVIINYSDAEYTYGDIQIPPMDYTVIKE